MKAILGINTCFAVKRWPRPADWAPLVRDRLGLGLVQHSLDLVDLDASEAERSDQARETWLAAERAELKIHSTFTGLAAYSSNLLLHPDPAARRRALAWFRRAIDFTAAVGADGTGGHVGAMSVADWRDPSQRAARWEDLRSSLATIAGWAHLAGQRFFLVENLASAREPSTLAEMADLLTIGGAAHVPIRACLDVGHQCVAGTTGPDRDPYAWLERLGAGAEVVQLQQSDAEGDHHWPFTPQRNAAGRIEAERVIDALEAAGADLPILVLEVIPSFEQDDDEVMDDLVRSVDYWRDGLDRRGVQLA